MSQDIARKYMDTGNQKGWKVNDMQDARNEKHAGKEETRLRNKMMKNGPMPNYKAADKEDAKLHKKLQRKGMLPKDKK